MPLFTSKSSKESHAKRKAGKTPKRGDNFAKAKSAAIAFKMKSKKPKTKAFA